MKLQRKLTNKEWEEIVKEGPGVRMYRGKRTLFYNGEILYDENAREFLIYEREERESWEAIIILPGVEVIPEFTFGECGNIKTVVMADTVKRIGYDAFSCCFSLEFVKLSRNLECIELSVFLNCESLTSIFIPPSCREIGKWAFSGCTKLIILNVPQTTELGWWVISNTKLIKASHFEEDELQLDEYENYQNNEQVNAWIKNMNDEEKYALHKVCASFNPTTDIIYGIVSRQGLTSFQKKNEIGMTPLQYLEENPFADIDQQKLMIRYILAMMGEAV